jgi:hypothetical protein
MKPRRWILALLLLAVLVGVALPLAWRSFDLGEGLRRDLVRRLTEAGLSEVAIASVEPAWIGLDLADLRFASRSGDLRLSVARTRLRLSPLRWLKSLGEPLAALDLLELRQPVLDWNRAWGDPRGRESGVQILDGAVLDRLRRHLGLLPEIRLRDGRIRTMLHIGQEPRVVVDRLQGLLVLYGEQVELLLRSQLLAGDPRGFEFDLRLDSETMDGHFALALDSLRLGSELFPALAGLAEGELQSSFHMAGSLRGGELDSLDGAGWLRVDELRLAHLPEPLSLELRLVADREGLALEDGRLAWRGQELRIQGRSDLALRSPVLEGRGEGLELAALLAGLGLDDPPRGRLDLAGRAGLDSLGWWVDGRLGAGELAYHDEDLGRFEARLAGNGRELELLHWLWEHPTLARAEGQGRWALVGPRPGLKLDGRALLEPGRLPVLGPHLNPQSRLQVALELDWAQLEPRGRWGALMGHLDGRLLEQAGESLRLIGSARLERLRAGHWPAVDLSILSPEGEALGLLQVDPGPSGRWRLESEPAEGLLRRLLADTDWLPAGRLALGLEGWPEGAQAHLVLSRPGLDARLDGELLFEGDGARLGADLLLAGRRGSEVRGRLNAELQPRTILLHELGLDDGLVIQGSLDLVERRYRLEARAEDLPLQVLWDLSFEDPVAFEPGVLSVQLAGEGALDSLSLRGGMEYRLRGGERRLALKGELEIDAGQAALSRAQVILDGRSLADLGLRASLDGQEGFGWLRLREEDLARWFPDWTLEGSPLLGGLASGSGELNWREGRDLQGGLRLQVSGPRLAGRAFEHFDLSLSRAAGEPGLRLDSLVLRRGGGVPLRLDAAGRLPLHRADDLDLRLRVDGDLLQPLSVTAAGAPSTFFRRASGPGRFELLLGGTLVDPVLREGRLQIRGGRLEMQSVFQRLRDLELDLEIEDGRVDILRCEGRIGRDRLVVGNLLPEELPGELDLEPWRFDLGELDFGVLTLATLDRRGRPGPIDLNIPGLMESGWDARVELAGRAPGEPCLLAGPLEHPRLRGTARVSNARFTYPFLEGDGEPTPLLLATIEFLNSIDWDLGLVAGRNINYYRKLQGFEDAVLFDRLQGYLDRITVDLWIEPSPRPLLISGQVEDGSFRLQGEVTSRRGSVLYLDKDFEVDEAGLVFDSSSLLPVVWGRATRYVLSEVGEASQPVFSRGDRALHIQLVTRDELGNRQSRGRWNEISLELLDDLLGNQDLVQRGQEELLVELGINPYEPATAFEEVLPGVVAGLWEIPLQPVESRLRRELGLDMVRIYVPVVRNTVEELLATQTRQSRVSQSYLSYLQGTRMVLGKSLGRRTFASWTGQLVSPTAVERSDEARLYQRWNLDYEVSRGLSLTGELVFDPTRDQGVLRGDPRLVLRYRVDY